MCCPAANSYTITQTVDCCPAFPTLVVVTLWQKSIKQRAQPPFYLLLSVCEGPVYIGEHIHWRERHVNSLGRWCIGPAKLQRSFSSRTQYISNLPFTLSFFAQRVIEDYFPLGLLSWAILSSTVPPSKLYIYTVYIYKWGEEYIPDSPFDIISPAFSSSDHFLYKVFLQKNWPRFENNRRRRRPSCRLSFIFVYEWKSIENKNVNEKIDRYLRTRLGG